MNTLARLILYVIATVAVLFLFSIEPTGLTGSDLGDFAVAGVAIYLVHLLVGMIIIILGALFGAVTAKIVDAEALTGAGCGLIFAGLFIGLPAEVYIWTNASEWGRLAEIIPEVSVGPAILITVLGILLSLGNRNKSSKD